MPTYTHDPQSSPFKAIASAVANQVITVTGLDSSCVRVVASDKYDLYVPSIGDKAVIIRFFGPEPFTDAGGGRMHRPTKRLIRVYLWFRDSNDQAGSDTDALLENGGLIDFEEQVFSALDEFFPTSGTTPLTIEPLHPIDSSEGPPERKPEDDTGWVRSYINFEVSYVVYNRTPQ